MSRHARREYRRTEVTVEPPTLLRMSERDRPAAVAALARWFAELLADESFQQRHQQRLASRDHDNQSG